MPKKTFLNFNNPQLGPNTLVIYSDNGKYYVINENEWKIAANEFPAGPNSTAGVLIERGTVLANVPIDGPPVGYACKLLNLKALNGPKTPRKPRRRRKQK